MRITKNEAVCVYQGGRPEELHWGFVQFPWLYNTADGNILISIHCEDDAPFAIDGGKSYLKSADGGNFIAALSAKVCLEQENAYYTSPAFNGSSTARDQVGLLMQSAFTSNDGGNLDAMIDELFAKAIKECKR